MKAPDWPSHTSLWAQGWKDVLHLLKKQYVKMEKLARALSVIQQGMLRNNPGHVKDSVSEATEVLSGMLNAHKCLLESGVEIQKGWNPTSPRKGWVSFGDRVLRLWEIPKKADKEGEERCAFTPEERISKKGKGSTSPSYAAVLNRGRDFTFRRRAGGSIINLTFAAPRLASRIVDWCVLQVITLSLRQSASANLMERWWTASN